jgi:hypothetical protein
MRRVKLYCLSFLLLGLSGFAFCQEPTPSLDQLRTMSREERIKAHQRRIEQIIQENKRRQEEEARKAAEARQRQQQATPQAGQLGAPATSMPLPQGPVQVYMPPQPGRAQPPQPTTAPPAAPSTRSEARSMLFFRPYDSIVKVGQTFVTELVVDTKDGQADEIQFTLTYPAQNLNLLAVDFAPVVGLLHDEVEYASEPGDGIFAARLKLTQPQKFTSRPIAVCYWEALQPADPAEVRFDFSGEIGTDIRLGGTSILGTEGLKTDGVIHANVLIKSREKRNYVQQTADKGLLVGGSSFSPPSASLTLNLDAPPTAKIGEEVVVDLELKNPHGDPFDRVQLYLQFDPEVLEVIDSDKGNWIKQGINIEDGFAHKDFPFDFHKFNAADNAKGIIIYDEGAALNPLRSSGVFAKVHFRIKKSVPQTEILLVRNEPGRYPNTDVSYAGMTVLENYPSHASILAQKNITIQSVGALAAIGK